MARPLLPTEVAVGSGHGLHQGQGPGPDPRRFAGSSTRAVVVETSTPCCGAGGPTSAMATRRGSSTPVDSYVHERLAILASRQARAPGRNWATRFNYGWLTNLGIYRLTGTVRYRTAHA